MGWGVGRSGGGLIFFHLQHFQTTYHTDTLKKKRTLKKQKNYANFLLNGMQKKFSFFSADSNFNFWHKADAIHEVLKAITVKGKVEN